MTSQGICERCGVPTDLVMNFGCPERWGQVAIDPNVSCGHAVEETATSCVGSEHALAADELDPDYASLLEDSSNHGIEPDETLSDSHRSLESPADRLANVAALLVVWQRYADITDAGLPEAATAYRRCCRELREHLLGDAGSPGW